MRAWPLVFLLAHVLTLRIHAASLVLSEFMASNHHTLADGNGNFPDWIEIYNSGDLPMVLANWHLTDNPANLSLWTFPGVTLQPRGFLVVFASGAGAPDAQGRLHTNFQLAREGGFLALVEPDGVTVASSFNYPAQFDDVSYGPAIAVSSTKIVGIGAPARMFVTTASNASELGILWTGGNEPFNDALWSDVVLPIGYDSADTNAPVNAALGKPVIASGPTWPGLPKENLTDGNLTSFTHCAVPEPASWFLVDLGATYALDHLELFNRTDGCCLRSSGRPIFAPMARIPGSAARMSFVGIWTTTASSPDVGSACSRVPTAATATFKSLSCAPLFSPAVRVMRPSSVVTSDRR